MALLDAGYFPTTYFCSSYWQISPQYFPEYGAPTPPTAGVGGGARRGRGKPPIVRQKLVKPEPFDRETLQLIKQYLELKQHA